MVDLKGLRRMVLYHTDAGSPLNKVFSSGDTYNGVNTKGMIGYSDCADSCSKEENTLNRMCGGDIINGIFFTDNLNKKVLGITTPIQFAYEGQTFLENNYLSYKSLTEIDLPERFKECLNGAIDKACETGVSEKFVHNFGSEFSYEFLVLPERSMESGKRSIMVIFNKIVTDGGREFLGIADKIEDQQ